MDGFQLTFFFDEDSRHQDRPLGEWLLQLTRETGLRGATLLRAGESVSQVQLSHFARFFGQEDRAIAAVVLATTEECDWLLARIEAEEVTLGYVKAPVEFGVLRPPSRGGRS